MGDIAEELFVNLLVISPANTLRNGTHAAKTEHLSWTSKADSPSGNNDQLASEASEDLASHNFTSPSALRDEILTRLHWL